MDAPFILFLISRRKRSRIPSFQKSGNSFLAVIKKSLFFILQYFPSTIGSISFKGRNFIQSFVTDGSASAASETLGDRIVTRSKYHRLRTQLTSSDIAGTRSPARRPRFITSPNGRIAFSWGRGDPCNPMLLGGWDQWKYFGNDL